MRFFGPTSTPLLNEETAPMVRRALQRARMVGRFASVQMLVQAIGFISGILIVRYLSQREYAYFTIANTMQGTINMLADIGISIGLVSIGGRVWQDRHRFGQLITTAQKLRFKLGGLALLVVTPILYLMLARNGASVGYAVLIIVFMLGGLSVHFSLGVLSVVPRLRSDIAVIQKIDLTGATARMLVLVACAFVFLNAGLAILIGSASFFIQLWLTRRYVAGVIDMHASENEDDRRAMIGFIKNQAANAIFYCIQGQITVFLISFFGTRASSVAEVGALGRLAMIFTIVGQLLTNIFGPAFARCQDPKKMRLQFAGVVSAVLSLSILIFIAAALFPDQFLFILGHKYEHLHRELILMVAGTVANVMVGTLWVMNASKAWISFSWLYIPLTLATQVALIPFTDFSSVSGLLIFNLFSTLPNLLVNIALSCWGFRSLRTGSLTS